MPTPENLRLEQQPVDINNKKQVAHALIKFDRAQELINYWRKQAKIERINSYRESLYDKEKLGWAYMACLPVFAALPGALTLDIPHVGMVAIVSLIAIGVLAVLPAFVVRGLQRNERMSKIEDAY